MFVSRFTKKIVSSVLDGLFRLGVQTVANNANEMLRRFKRPREEHQVHLEPHEVDQVSLDCLLFSAGCDVLLLLGNHG